METKETLLADQSLNHQDAQLMLGQCSKEDPAFSRISLKIYSRRWIILFVVAFLNNTNTMSWIAYAPIANHADSFYYQKNAANYFSIVYILCTIPVGIFAMWAGRYFGLRWAILIAAYSNGIGGIIRFLSYFFTENYRFIVGITGQGISGLAYPFIMFLPTKVAASWFPDNQRAFATTIGVMSNPLGVIMANLLAPYIVNKPSQIFYLNALTASLSFIVLIIATIFVKRSEPKLPPTFSASRPSLGFLKGLHVCMTNKDYIILLIVLGGGIGMFNCLYTIIQQLLCPSGYSNSFSGWCAALMIIGGVFGAASASIFVDKTKAYKETMKFAMAIAVVFGLIFLQLVLHRDIPTFILFTCFFFGVFGLATYPVGLEMSAECTYPVSETTSTGIIVISGQIQSIIYFSLMNSLARPLQSEYLKYQVCSVDDKLSPNSTEPKDMTVSVIVMSCVAGALVLILILFFRPKYRRMEAEHKLMPNISANGLKEIDEIDKPADAEIDLTINNSL